MRKVVLQRWALIFLLVSRFVIGELGYAAPMAHGGSHSHEMAHEMALVESDSADCAEHELESASDTSETEECCKTGECECPCLHVPCGAVESLTIGPADLEGQPLMRDAEGLMLQRLSGLFRPPA